jgi:hypothetical protein
MKKVENLKEGTINEPSQIPETSKHGEIKSDEPLSEKDEEKKVEEKMRKAAKKRG